MVMFLTTEPHGTTLNKGCIFLVSVQISARRWLIYFPQKVIFSVNQCSSVVNIFPTEGQISSYQWLVLSPFSAHLRHYWTVLSLLLRYLLHERHHIRIDIYELFVDMLPQSYLLSLCLFWCDR